MTTRRPRSPLLTVLTRVPFMMALGCGTTLPQGPLSTFCPQDTSAGSGNVDKPAGVALAVRQNDDGSTSAFAVSLNPDLRQARAVDLTQGLMVPAPNVYFPMAVKLGTYSEDIAMSDDGRVAVVLDAQDRTLRFFDVGSEKLKNTWRRHGDLVERLDARATGLAVLGPLNDMRILVSHAGDPDGSVTLVRWSDGNVTQMKRIVVGGSPTDVAWLPGDAPNLAVVSNGASGQVFVLDPDADESAFTLPLPACSGGTRPCAVDVGGPTGDVVVGRVLGRPRIGEEEWEDMPRYPVAVLVRADQPAVSVVRLKADAPGTEPWALRMASPVDRLFATVMLPAYGVAAALAPERANRCCDGVPYILDPAALGEGGFAYGVVALVTGDIAYLDLDAQDISGRRTPRLMDTNSTPPGPLRAEDCTPIDFNASTDNYVVPDAGVAGPPASDVRPRVEYVLTGDAFGDPPVVNQELGDDYVFRWEGALPGVRNRKLVSSAAQLSSNIVQDQRTGVDLVASGVRPGDLVDIPAQAACPCPTSQPDCALAAQLVVVAVAGSTMELDSTFAHRECLADPEGVTYSVRARGAFTVQGGRTGRFFGRAAFFQWVEVPGMKIRLLPAGWNSADPEPVISREGGLVDGLPVGVAVGKIPPRDTVLVVPMRSNFEPFILRLDDTNASSGRYIPAGSVPTGLVTGVAPVRGSGTEVVAKPVGILSTAGGGLVLQFDLGLYPSCSSPGSATCVSQQQCSPYINRGNLDPSFRFYE